MSEPSSLFARINIKKHKLDEFFKSKPEQSKLDDNWLKWWNSKAMYGNPELTQAAIRAYDDSTNEGIINAWKDMEQSFTFSDYDLENEIWHFGIIEFTDNYFEMIPALVFLKSVSIFKEKNPDDFAIIYDYFWGGNEVNAFIEYRNNKSFFESKIQRKFDVMPEKMNYADHYLTKKLIR